MPREVHKAVCYVLHDEHLLVFTHRDLPLTVTGVQVPAGTIEFGESPEQAAVRELLEEISLGETSPLPRRGDRHTTGR